ISQRHSVRQSESSDKACAAVSSALARKAADSASKSVSVTFEQKGGTCEQIRARGGRRKIRRHIEGGVGKGAGRNSRRDQGRVEKGTVGHTRQFRYVQGRQARRARGTQSADRRGNPHQGCARAQV